jgi:cytochrome c oxidase cbb3-type subunit III
MKGLAFAVVLLFVLTFNACKREERRFSDIAPLSGRPQPQRMSELQPGTGTPGAPASKPIPVALPAQNGKGPYDENAWAVSEGKRLYTWYNCVGCHAHGGGGIGPPLMWIYASEPEKIYAAITEGRPNGMPAFGGRIPSQQVWQIVAYIRSLRRLARKDVRPGRDDHMALKPSEQSSEPRAPKISGSPPPHGERP